MNNKNMYIMLLVLTTIITGMTIAVSIMKTAGTEESLFNGPAIVFVLVAYVAIQVLCIVNIRGSLTVYRIGFYVLHCGLILMLCGMFIYYIKGDKVENVSVPVSEDTYSRIQRASTDIDISDEMNNDASDDDSGNSRDSSDSRESSDSIGGNSEAKYVELDFALGVSSFEVEKYEDGSDKFYDAKLKLVKRGVADPIYETFRVNHPVRVNGWKIYLMNYEETPSGKVVYIMLKNNPGEYITLAGIWMTIIGGFIMCLLRKRGAK